jgi:hypothetical protein
MKITTDRTILVAMAVAVAFMAWKHSRLVDARVRAFKAQQNCIEWKGPNHD